MRLVVFLLFPLSFPAAFAGGAFDDERWAKSRAHSGERQKVDVSYFARQQAANTSFFLQLGEQKCGTSETNFAYASCSDAKIANYSWAIDGPTDPASTSFTLKSTKGTLLGTAYDMNADECKCDETMQPTCACVVVKEMMEEEEDAEKRKKKDDGGETTVVFAILLPLLLISCCWYLCKKCFCRCNSYF